MTGGETVDRPGTADRAAPAVARLHGVRLTFGKTRALDGIDLAIPAGRMVGLIGPDGVGKSSLLSLIAGAQRIQQGRVMVLNGDMADARHRRDTCPRIAYMPQGLGKNLYATLSVFENVDFFGRLFGSSPKVKPEQYRVQVAQVGSDVEVNVLNKDGGPETSKTGQRILGLLHEQLK